MATVEFSSLTTKDDDGNIIIDVTELSGDTLTTNGYEIKYQEYNVTNCYTCQDKTDSSIKWVIPILDKTIGSPYGYRQHPTLRDENNKPMWKMHYGVDLGSRANFPILAVRDGKVTTATFQPGEAGGGHYVIIDHGDGFQTKYLHMGPAGHTTGVSKYSHIVKVDQQVTAGQIIGSVGTSGASSGPHLHFSLIYNNENIDPQSHIDFDTKTRENLSTVDLRVQKELPSHDDFVPMFGANNTIKYDVGSPTLFHMRRGCMINDCVTPLFDSGKQNRRFGTGSSCIGPTSFVVRDSYSKDEILSLYKDKTDGFTIPSGEGDAETNDCLKIAKYIYNKMVNTYGWSSEATFALLGNMYSESGLNPNRSEVGGSGYGLIQWTPKSTFTTWYNNNKSGKNWVGYHDIDAQLECVSTLSTWIDRNMITYYNNHMSGYIRNINPDNPESVEIEFYGGDRVTPPKGYLWTNYYKGNNSDTERRAVYNELNYCYNNGGSFGVTSDSFKVSRSSIGLLTVMYAVNGEGPAALALKPWLRVEAAYTFSHYMRHSAIKMPLNDEYFKLGMNPFIDNTNSSNNNAFAWATAMRIADRVSSKPEEVKNAIKRMQNNWYEYNKKNKLLNYGQVPRKYSIACWKYLGYSANSKFEETRLAIVDDVLGTDVIDISEYPHGESTEYPKWSDIKESDFYYHRISNPDYNWGQDKSRYKFLGFIYLLDNAEINPVVISNTDTGAITVSATMGHQYSTILFGTTDIKHYNSIRIFYDVNVYNLKGNASKLDCGINISVSHQVLNCEKPDSNWKTTGFNKAVDYGTSEGDFTYKYPFPMGVLRLHDENLKGLVGKGVTSYDKTFKLNSCVIDDKTENPFNIDEYAALNRELPLYISVTPISYESDNKNSVTVEVTLKKIILYR